MTAINYEHHPIVSYDLSGNTYLDGKAINTTPIIKTKCELTSEVRSEGAGYTQATCIYCDSIKMCYDTPCHDPFIEEVYEEYDNYGYWCPECYDDRKSDI